MQKTCKAGKTGLERAGQRNLFPATKPQVFYQPTLRCWEQRREVVPGLERSMAVTGSGFAVKEEGAQLHKASQ